MGNQLAVGGSLQELHLQDLAEGIVQERTLGGGRLLKSVQCWTEDGMPVVVKVYLKKEDDPSLALQPHHEKLKLLCEKLSLKNQPNVLSYHRMVETDKAGYLVRQYCYSNLADRISTRPFFSALGKKWIAYQILSGLHQIKMAGLSHGDIKAENIVLTGWDWVFLTDLAPFKPVILPADDPSNFAYFFDTAERRICLIAPERFSSSATSTTIIGGVSSSNSSSSSSSQDTSSLSVTEQMDIFSVGCVLAQLFLEGEALFDLSQLLAYRKGDREHLSNFLNRIEDRDVREMITHMLQLDPEKRYTAKQYMQNWTPTVFPDYFQWVHEHIMSQMVVKSCDERILHISERFEELVQVFNQGIVPGNKDIHDSNDNSKQISQFIQQQNSTDNSTTDNTKASDIIKKKLSRISDTHKYDDSDEISVSDIIEQASNFKNQLGLDRKKLTNQNERQEHLNQYKQDIQKLQAMKNNVTIERRTKESKLFESQNDRSSSNRDKFSSSCEGAEIIASLLCSSVRNARSVSSRVKGLSLIQHLSDFSSNYTRLQRLVPYTCVMLNDPSPLVKAAAIRTLTYVLTKITKFPASEANLFNDYILPALRTLSSDTSDLVRVAFAEHLPLLAYEARRFFEMGEVIKQVNVLRNTTTATNNSDDESSSGSMLLNPNSSINQPIIKGTYDADLNFLQDEIASIALSLSMDECASVKRALLQNIIQLCIFYGRRKTNEFVLPMTITFLNCREWRLRHAFFEQIVAISLFVGPTSLKEFILPCLMQALYDHEEFVIEQDLNAFVALCELGMFDKRTLLTLAKKISPLLHHPNSWIRYDSVAFFAAMSKQLGLADTNCFLLDILKPHLEYSIYVVSENSLLDAVKPSVARHIFDKVLNSPIENLQSLGPSTEETLNISSDRWKQALHISEISEDDAEKLNLMKSYIDQTARSMQSKLWEQVGTDSHFLSSDLVGSSSAGGEPIKLSHLPLQTHFIAVESPFASLQAPPSTGAQPSINTGNRANRGANTTTGDQKPFNNEWNTFFNKQNPRKIVRTNKNQTTLSGAPHNSSNAVSGTVPSTSGSGISGDRTPTPLVTASGSSSSNHTYAVPMLSKKDLNRFRPTGQICAQSHEHKGSINELAVHDSLSWFVSAGNDSTVRLWDLTQADRDYSMVSKLTCALPPQAGKVMTVAVLNMGPPLIAAGTDRGWLNFFSADLGTVVYSMQITDNGTQFMPDMMNSMSRSQLSASTSVYSQQLPSVNVVRPFPINSTPLLMVGNQSGMILGIDPRIRREAFVWKSKESIQQGPITALCGEESWMVSGTRRGFLTLWDLRFQLSVSTSRITHTSINRMGVLNESAIKNNNKNQESSSPSIYVAAGTRDIKLWNLESKQVSAVYRCFDKRITSQHSGSSATGMTSARSRQLSSSHSSMTSSSDSQPPPSPTSSPTTASSPLASRRRMSATASAHKDPFAIKELERINWEKDDLGVNHAHSPFEVKALHVNSDGNFLSGSSDCRIRFWDVDHSDQCYVVSGLDSTESSMFSVQTDVPTASSSNFNGSVSVNTTKIVSESIKELPLSQTQSRRGGAFAAPIATKHVDTVTDIKLVGTHTPMVLSSSRDGVLKLWI